MSYDVSLMVNVGGEGWVEAFSRNHTSNTARMWREAGCDLAEFHGKSAAELGISLRPALADIVGRPSHYAQWNPENRWGSVATTVGFLGEIAEACDRFPAAVVEVSR